MRVAVTGANGAVGGAIVGATWQPLELLALVRSGKAAAQVRALGGATRVECLSYDDAAGLARALEGSAAVIHLPGILVERGGATYEAANVETTRQLARAAVRAGVGKIVLVSAVDADSRSANRYWRTKGEAEAIVCASGLPWTVLRVPMLLGPGTAAASALRRRLGSRTVWLVGGDALQQPLDVDDVARAAVVASASGLATHRTLDLVGPEALPARELVTRAARSRGQRVRIVSLPAWPFRTGVRLLRRLFSRRFSLDALEVLTTGTCLDPGPAAATLGIELTPLDRTIARSLDASRAAGG